VAPKSFSTLIHICVYSRNKIYIVFDPAAAETCYLPSTRRTVFAIKLRGKKSAEKLPRVARAMVYYAATGATPHAAAALRRINAFGKTLFSKTLTNSGRTTRKTRKFNIISNIIFVTVQRVSVEPLTFSFRLISTTATTTTTTIRVLRNFSTKAKTRFWTPKTGCRVYRLTLEGVNRWFRLKRSFRIPICNRAQNV